MIQVNLRSKAIAQGRLSLYLDFWPPVILNESKKTRREFLRLYVFSKPKTSAQKKHNHETFALAETIKARRQLEVQNHAYGVKRMGSDIRLEDFLVQEAKKRIPQTAHQWGYMIRHIRMSGLHILSLSELDVRECIKFRDYLQSLVDKRKLKTNTVANYLSYFRTAIRSAYRAELIADNLVDRFDRFPDGKSVRAFLTLDELNRLVRTPTRSRIVRQVALFAALTGLRTSDLRALKWSNVIEHENGTVSLHYRQVKTKKDEQLPISLQARNLLGERMNGNVFPMMRCHSSLNETLGLWVRRAGINKHITMHCLRHTYATLQLSAGTDIYTVSKLLGHSDVKTTQIYAKVLDESKRDAVDRVKIAMLG
ncbi:MAG: site-specific integrase [Chlorobiaceae bacterium]